MLYTKLSDLRIPDSVQETAAGKSVNYQVINVGACVNWPDSKPCIAVNMYLLENASQWTGDTAVTYASELSALVRHCYARRISFDALTDGEIYGFVEHLKAEEGGSGTFIRNNNTTRRILHRSLSFLMWYQQNLHCGAIPLIGDDTSNAAIRVERRTNERGNFYWTHRYAPESNSTDPKLPIDLSIIEAIDVSIEQLSIRENLSEPATRPYKKRSEFLNCLLSYHYARRRFMIWIVQRTGLRPSEMVGLPLAENRKQRKQPVIIIPTMKRRKLNPPPRVFAITEKDARVVMRYLSARDNWVQTCSANDPTYKSNDAMFLSVAALNYGFPIAKSGLTHDFKVLCAHAGHKNSEACFSMFRHRFITWEVLSHLKAWETEKGRPPSEQDYRSILEKVRIRTGHADAMSLWHYIHLAQEMAGVWVNVDRATARLHAADHLRLDLVEMRHELLTSGARRMAAEQILNIVIDRLQEIITSANASGL